MNEREPGLVSEELNDVLDQITGLRQIDPELTTSHGHSREVWIGGCLYRQDPDTRRWSVVKCYA